MGVNEVFSRESESNCWDCLVGHDGWVFWSFSIGRVDEVAEGGRAWQLVKFWVNGKSCEDLLWNILLGDARI